MFRLRKQTLRRLKKLTEATEANAAAIAALSVQFESFQKDVLAAFVMADNRLAEVERALSITVMP